MLGQLFILAASTVDSHAAAAGAGPIETYGINVPHIAVQTLSFVILAFVIYRWGFKSVLITIDERQKKISDGLQYAEEMKNKLADAEREHTAKIQAAQKEAQDIIAQARDNAKAYLDKQTQEAAGKAEDIIRKAAEANELERKKMLSEVREEVTRLVVDTTSKVLSKDLSDDEKSRFSKTAADELTSVGS